MNEHEVQDQVHRKRPLTISVPEAGRRLGIGRNLSYEAAKHRQIPTIRIGRRLLVPVAALEKLLNADIG
jgi:excisionase family DNA binding protein